METATILNQTISDMITSFNNHVCINDRTANHGSALDDCARKEDGVPHISTRLKHNPGEHQNGVRMPPKCLRQEV
jgi:hypothetical protein